MTNRGDRLSETDHSRVTGNPDRFGHTLAIILTLIWGGLYWSEQPRAQTQNQAQPQVHTQKRHGLSLFGPVKYPPDFTHYNYVNPDAPKGGTLRLGVIGGFDSLNPFFFKGRPAAGEGLLYDPLMAGSLDEPASVYGLIAESVTYPPNHSSVTFYLRREARFHDGTPITAADVVWSFNALKQSHPFYRYYYADVTGGHQDGPHTVTFEFAVSGNRELPHIMGQLPILPSHYWADKEFAATTLTPPPGSGAYRIADVDANRTIIYERVRDYWGANLPVNRGSHNFDRIVFDYYRDDTAALEAFKAGKIDLRTEISARKWNTAYNIDQVARGDIIRLMPPTANVQGMQGFVFNTRRVKFSDPKVREAFNWAFDFEWTNKDRFYGQYVRHDSYFDNSELASSGLPSEDELTLLAPHRDLLPAALFEQAYKNPATDGSGRNRGNLRTATRLLAEAGWRLVDGNLTHEKTGEIMEVEFLLVQPDFERVVTPWVSNLERLGITVTIRIVDSAQYTNRLDDFDFDIVVSSYPQSHSPGNEQRDFWGSEAARQSGGRNLAGIQSPVVDDLIEQIIFAPDRATQITAVRALDRVLLWNHYVVPNWYAPTGRIAHWRYLKHPDPLPGYSIGMPAIWWHTGTP
ncbi:MAG: extracellular solute-binding protein [Parvularculales bacterium]